MKTRKIITLIMLSLVAVILLSSKVQANYQSVPTGNSKEATATEWITGIRQMESSGNGMGLKETIDTTTGLATTETNNIDVHMLKNTEYGAIVLLGASDYGKQGTDITARRMDTGAVTGTSAQASTTGNKYGIYEIGYISMITGNNTNYEWTAGGGTSFLSGIASRYINRYTTADSSARAGDATVETKNWHGSSNAYWLSVANYGFNRGYRGAFSFYNGGESNSNYARAGVVVGVGL